MKVPLLEYLDKLEATAKAAPQGIWSSPRASLLSLREIVAVGSSGLPNDRRSIAEYFPAEAMRHIVESQPRVTLALIAKLREAVQFAKDLSVDICEHPTTGELVKAALQRKIDALHLIEVPE